MKTPAELIQFLESGMHGSMTYADYRQMGIALHAEGRTTGPNQSADLVSYAKMNEQRMHRLDKTVTIVPELTAVLKAISSPQTWIVITEDWCGDAAQNVPALAKMAAINPLINLRLILRDENPQIMQHFLTNGGTSIPVFIVLNETNQLLAHWAPRPAPAQKMLIDWKKAPEPKMSFADFATELHKWYAHDKTVTLQAEMLSLFSGLN